MAFYIAVGQEQGVPQFVERDALFLSDRDVKRQQDRRRGVDGHARAHRAQVDAVKQPPHIRQGRDRHPATSYLPK